MWKASRVSKSGTPISTFKGKRLPNGKKNRHRPRVPVESEDASPSPVPDAKTVTVEKAESAEKKSSSEKKVAKAESSPVKKEEETTIAPEKKTKNKTKVSAKDDPRLSRTIFIGNVPLGVRQQDISRLVSPYGKVESVRICGVVPNAPGIPKKAALLSKRLHPGVDTQNCYVVFCDEVATESIAKACSELNMTKLEDCNIRVTAAAEDEVCDRRTIYAGNLPYDTTEQVFLEAFLKATEDSSFEITAARLARDKFGAGRGFGFVTFDDELGARFAMGLQGKVDVAGRIARITKVAKQSGGNMRNNNYRNANNKIRGGRISKRNGDRNGHRNDGPKNSKFNHRDGDRNRSGNGNGYKPRSSGPTRR